MFDSPPTSFYVSALFGQPHDQSVTSHRKNSKKKVLAAHLPVVLQQQTTPSVRLNFVCARQFSLLAKTSSRVTTWSPSGWQSFGQKLILWSSDISTFTKSLSCKYNPSDCRPFLLRPHHHDKMSPSAVRRSAPTTCKTCPTKT